MQPQFNSTYFQKKMLQKVWHKIHNKQWKYCRLSGNWITLVYLDNGHSMVYGGLYGISAGLAVLYCDFWSKGEIFAG